MTEENNVGSIRTRKAIIRKEMLSKRRALSEEERNEEQYKNHYG